MNNRWTIFCLARCGSALASQLLTYQVHHYSPFLCIDTPINPGFGCDPKAPYNGSEYLVLPHVAREAEVKGITVEEEYAQRFETIKYYTDRGLFPVIKNVIPFIPEHTYAFLKKAQYKIAVIKRRNLLDQFLSYQISARTFFHTSKDSKAKRSTEPFTVSRAAFDEFVQSVRTLNALEADKTVYYEDFVRNYSNFYKQMGLYTDITKFDFIVTRELDDGNKLNFTTNANEILEWFDEQNTIGW
jgi:hypothetical protein